MKKACIKKIIFLYYLIFLIFIILCASIIMLFMIIDNTSDKATSEHRKNDLHSFSIFKEDVIQENLTQWNKKCDWNLIVTNNKNPLPEQFNLNLKSYNNIDIDFRVIYHLNEMISDAENQNIKLWVSSGYRSYEKQNKLFLNKIQEFLKNGYSIQDAENLSQKIVAKPGASEHHLGLAIDFNGVKEDFCLTNEYNWLIDNCVNYGFILRYPKDKQDITEKVYEPWHFRYVGESHAKKMKQKNMCLEEYVSYLIKKL